MNFRKKRRGGPAALQMTALMDVVFLLLCFFVTTSVFSQWETEVAIALPTAKIALETQRLQEGIYFSERLGREVTSDEIESLTESKALEIPNLAL